jgi:hypothetical protein
LAAVLERTDHQLCMPELMAAKLAATAPNGGYSRGSCRRADHAVRSVSGRWMRRASVPKHGEARLMQLGNGPL